MKFKLGIIGAGNMGKNHIRIAKELMNEFDLVSVFDTNYKRIEALGLEEIAAQSEDELIEKVGAVVIAAPSSLHKRLAIKVAQAGKHLLVEKPLALSYEDAMEVVKFFNPLNKVLMVGHVERFNNAIIELEKVLQHEEIIAVQMERCSSMDRRISDTDVVYDLMIHDMDILLNSILPDKKIQVITSFGETVYSNHFRDFVQSIMQFEDGIVASVICSRATEDKIRMVRIHCRNAYIVVDLLNKTLTVSRKTTMKLDVGYSPVYRQENILERVYVPGKEPLKEELLHFHHCMETGCTCRTNGVSATQSIKVLEAIKEQIYR